MEDSGPTIHPIDLFELGNSLLARGDAAEAVNAFRRCLAAAPDHAATSFNLGNALIKAHRPVEAVDAFVACLRKAPDFAAAYVNLATTLRGLTLLEQAQAMAETAVRLLPAEPEAKICLAGVLHDRSQYDAAAALYRQALSSVPGHAGALSSLGNSLQAMGNLTGALAAHDRAVAAAPDDAESRFSRATSLLAAGDFAAGWNEYEWRWQRARSRSRGFGKPWAGEDIGGRTILLHAEQGLGDTLQFVRYAPMVATRGGRVVLEVQPSLVRLMRTISGIGHVLARGDPLPVFDAHCPLLSLPRAFATRLETIPADIPYLNADAAAAALWRARLPDDGGLRVGLMWAGSPHTDDAGAHLIDRRRSLAQTELAPLGGVGGVHLVSLQKDPPKVPDEVRRGLSLIDPMADVVDFADTAALVANLDLVISVDTSVAHLAGALGRPVWLLSRYDACWRWLDRREDSPWYPGMRIYQQERPLDWSGVIGRVRADLAAFVRHGTAV
ncbi:MAG: tetratricopeptide repeat protein [Rhodopila sp.]|jgi:tetratricopeptide (TPR) repeat protein